MNVEHAYIHPPHGHLDFFWGVFGIGLGKVGGGTSVVHAVSRDRFSGGCIRFSLSGNNSKWA